MRRNTQLGRPTLLESHRFNYVDPHADEALAVLQALIRTAVQSYRDIEFMSTRALAEIYRSNDLEALAAAPPIKLYVWFKRVFHDKGVVKRAVLTGACVPAALLFVPIKIWYEMRSRVR